MSNILVFTELYDITSVLPTVFGFYSVLLDTFHNHGLYKELSRVETEINNFYSQLTGKDDVGISRYIFKSIITMFPCVC
jgi:hypothetical protein